MKPTLELSGHQRWAHPIFVADGLLADDALWRDLLAKFSKIAVVSDNNVAAALLPKLRQTLGDRIAVETVLPAGEANKNRDQKTRIETDWLKAGLGRDAVAIALGGGVVGDVAGFAAATYLRGIPVIQAPTSLVAMVDSSIGGKTGIDIPEGKNLIGAFHPPLAIVADLDALQSLPDAEMRYGLAEVVKHAIIADAALADFVDANLAAIFARDAAILQQLVATNVRIKGKVVMTDEREGDLRQVLNFGHTVGHALELLLDYQLPHGSGVALGTIAELHMAAEVRNFEQSGIVKARALLQKIGLPVTIADSRLSVEKIIQAAQTDKKSRAGSIRFALPDRFGRFLPLPPHGYAMPVSEDVVRRGLAEILLR